jgi:hypothetical protein
MSLRELGGSKFKTAMQGLCWCKTGALNIAAGSANPISSRERCAAGAIAGGKARRGARARQLRRHPIGGRSLTPVGGRSWKFGERE